jgi:nitronate monooxygenase
MTNATNDALMQRLQLALPVVQGPFGGGLSSTTLAAAVSNAGGLGSYGAHHLSPDAISAVTTELHGLTDRRFALNLWVSQHDAGGEQLDAAGFERWWPLFAPYFAELGLARPSIPDRVFHRFEDQFDALLAARPPVFSFVFGVPSKPMLDACRQRDIVTIGTATTIAEAQALEAAGVEIIVATGCEAGGHRVSFLESAEASLTGTFALTQLVAPRVRVPVVAAGGIADARGVRAAQLLGAQAAQIGTAFLACSESGATDAHRAALFDARAQHTALTRAFTGRLARGVRNRFTEDMASRTGEFAPYPIQGWFLAQLRPALVAAGRTDLVSVWSGQIAPNLEHRTVAALLDALREGLHGA